LCSAGCRLRTNRSRTVLIRALSVEVPSHPSKYDVQIVDNALNYMIIPFAVQIGPVAVVSRTCEVPSEGAKCGQSPIV